MSLTKREFIPSFGSDRKAIDAGMKWLLDPNVDQELFLFLSLKSHLKEGKIIYEMYGKDFCKTLQKNEKIKFNGKVINLLTDRSYSLVPPTGRILAIHTSNEGLKKIEKKYNFKNLLVVAWHCTADLPEWINKHGATQFQGFLPINPIKYPGWPSGETEPPSNFIFSDTSFEEYTK